MKYYVYGVYWQGICVYVGVTIDPKKRLTQHKNPTRGKLRDLPGLTMRIFRAVDHHLRAATLETQIMVAFWKRGQAKRNSYLTPTGHSQTVVPARRLGVCKQVSNTPRWLLLHAPSEFPPSLATSAIPSASSHAL